MTENRRASDHGHNLFRLVALNRLTEICLLSIERTKSEKAGFATSPEAEICVIRKTDIIRHGGMFIPASQITDQELSGNMCWCMIVIMLN
jgi:hypothetical protein